MFMVLESILVQIMIDMKANLKIHWNMVMEGKDLVTEITIKAIINKENLMVMENIYGPMDKYTEEIFIKEWDKEKEFGLVKLKMVINMMENIKWIKKMDKEHINLQMA